MKEMKGFVTQIEDATKNNNMFRKVLYTSQHLQLVLMSLQPNEDVGEEIHDTVDQFFRIEAGSGICTINGHKHPIKDGDAIIIPAGAKHNITNTDSSKVMSIYTIYTPPHHKDGIACITKKEAMQLEEEFDGTTTE